MVNRTNLNCISLALSFFSKIMFLKCTYKNISRNRLFKVHTNSIPYSSSFLSLATSYITSNILFKCKFKLFLHFIAQGKII